MAASRAKPGPPVEPDNAIIEHLISSGADVNARGESGLSALTMAVMMQGYWKGQPHDERAKPRLESLKQTIELLLASGAQKDIFSAAGLGDTERVAAILEADPSTVNAQRAFGMAPLQMAAMGGHRETVRLLVEHGANVFTYDVSDSPFRYAALVGNLEMFKLLEQLREKYRDRMRAGRREIYYYREAMKSAIQQGHSQIVAHLVDQERDIRAELMEYGLSEAAEEGQVEVVRILLDRGGQVYASPALYKAAESVCDKPEPDVTMERYIAIAKLLIDSGADVNAKDRTGSTPLLRAARNLRSYEHKSVNTDFFELLIEKGADVNAACRELRGELALICAVRADNLELAAMLLEAGADPLAAKEISGRDRTVLEIARDDSSKDMVELLAKYAEPGYGELKKRFEGTMKQFVEAVTKKDDEALMLVTSARREYDRKQWPKRADKIRTDYEEHYELLQEIVGVGTARGFAALFIARPEGSEQRYSRLLLMEFPDGGWRVLQFHPTDDSPDDAFKEARNAYESLDSYQKAVFEAAGRLEEVAPKIPTGMSSQMPDQGSVTVSVRDGNLRFDFGDQPEGRYTAVEVLADRVKHWRSKNLLGVARKLKLEKGDLLLEAKDGKATLTAPGRKCVVDAHEGKVRMQSEGKVLMADEFTFELLGLKPAAK
jgi:ankyrin repeat protein